METWLPTIAPLIAIAGLWWKITTSMATKADLHKKKDDIDKQFTEVKADIREIRQLFFSHISNHETAKQSNSE